MAAPRLIPPVFVPRVWGATELSRWYPQRTQEAEPIGEAWLTPPGAPVLVKLLWARDRLSVQVHPDDAFARARGWPGGKSEAWYVLEAAPEARLGLGLAPGVRWEDFAAACRAGDAADLLDWTPARAGDVVTVPAGTVHAIGAGLVLLEVQQPNDITFRLDDYGRGRELHLEHGLAAARASTDAGHVPAPPHAGTGAELLLDAPQFSLRRHRVMAGQMLPPAAQTRWWMRLSRERVRSPWPFGWLLEQNPGDEPPLPGENEVLLEIRGPVRAPAERDLGVDPNPASRENKH